MTTDLIYKLYFTICILSILVFIDAFIKIKIPLLLKFNFLTIIALIGLTSYLFSNGSKYTYNFILLMFSKGFIFLSILNIFTILYFPKLKGWIYFLATIFLLFVFSVFYNFSNSNLHFTNFNSISIFPLYSLQNNWPLYIRVNRVIFSVLLFSTLGYYCYAILIRFHYKNVYFDKVKNWSKFILFFTIYLFILYVPLTYFKVHSDIIYFNSILTHFVFLLIIFYRPVFLNKSSAKISFGDNFERESDHYISDLDFINIFFTKQYFINNNASLDDLAKSMDVSSNDLYKYIYYNYSMTFNDLVNKNRVDYFIQIIQNSKYNNFTIEALAKEAGFSSRQHLYKPFKKFHGGNPSDLIEAIT